MELITSEVLPSAFSEDESNMGFFGDGSAVTELTVARFTPLPTTPRCVTPPFVAAVEIIGESKPPLMAAIHDELEDKDLAALSGRFFSPDVDLEGNIFKSSDTTELGFDLICCRSSSCIPKEKLNYSHCQRYTPCAGDPM